MLYEQACEQKAQKFQMLISITFTLYLIDKQRWAMLVFCATGGNYATSHRKCSVVNVPLTGLESVSWRIYCDATHPNKTTVRSINN